MFLLISFYIDYCLMKLQLMTMPEKEKEGIDLKSMADATHEVAHGGQKAAKAVVVLVSFILS